LRERINRSQALGGVALAGALLGCGIGLSYVAPAHAHAQAPDASLTDTAPAPEPSPDPAPAPTKPKPVSKPARAPVHHAPVYSPPVHTTPTYTPTHVTPRTKPKVTHHRKHARHRRWKHVVAKPLPQPKPQVAPTVRRIQTGAEAAALTTNGDGIRRGLVIAGVGLAALLFLLVVTIPATAARFTAPGRVVMDHQTDLVLAGVATLLLTALLFAVTGTGS